MCVKKRRKVGKTIREVGKTTRQKVGKTISQKVGKTHVGQNTEKSG